MAEAKKTKSKPKTHIAKRNLATSNGNVKKGEAFTCTAKEEAAFKKFKAI